MIVTIGTLKLPQSPRMPESWARLLDQYSPYSPWPNCTHRRARGIHECDVPENRPNFLGEPKAMLTARTPFLEPTAVVALEWTHGKAKVSGMGTQTGVGTAVESVMLPVLVGFVAPLVLS